jgi:2-phosphosulfolactate phosphatase
MRVVFATLETCGTATGTVVVIDVLRAFTTAAHAFAAGAREIILAGQVQEALQLRERFPGALVMGEVGGLPVEGFDLSNSPTSLVGMDLRGRRLIQRTTAGTQGVVRSLGAQTLLAATFVCAGATAQFIRRQASPSVTFVITGAHSGRGGDEDRACADYLAALLGGRQPDPEPFLQRVRDSLPGRMFADPELPEFPAADLELATEVDRFDHALVVHRRDGLLVMEPA